MGYCWIILPKRDEKNEDKFVDTFLWGVGKHCDRYERSGENGDMLYVISPGETQRKHLLTVALPVGQEIRFWAHYSGVPRAKRFNTKFSDWLRGTYLQVDRDISKDAINGFMERLSTLNVQSATYSIGGDLLPSDKIVLEVKKHLLDENYDPFPKLAEAWSSYKDYVRRNTTFSGTVDPQLEELVKPRVIAHDLMNLTSPLLVDARVLGNPACSDQERHEVWADHIGEHASGYLSNAANSHVWIARDGSRTEGSFMDAVTHLILAARRHVSGLDDTDLALQQLATTVNALNRCKTFRGDFCDLLISAAASAKELVELVSRASVAAVPRTEDSVESEEAPGA